MRFFDIFYSQNRCDGLIELVILLLPNKSSVGAMDEP